MPPHGFHSQRAIKAMSDRLVGRLEEELGLKLRHTAAALRNTWSDPFSGHGLVSEVILEGGFGYSTSRLTLDQLANDGLLSRTLLAALDGASEEYRVDPRRRHPYTHQEESFRVAKAGMSMLVAAGTGSGKTECFLYPVLSELFDQQDRGALGHGVQALLLYPTNALINSQRDRLRAWLDSAPNRVAAPVKFCLYNSALTERPDRAHDGDGCELGSRAALWDQPPPILATNYSMLEIALIRRKDEPIFRKSLGKLRYVILDEAHSYQGVMAAEIALLLRRTLDAFGVTPRDVQFIATSATFPNVAPEILQEFASELFGVEQERVVIIRGCRIVPELAPAAQLHPVPSCDRIADLLGEDAFLTAGASGLQLNEDPGTAQRTAERLAASGFRVSPDAARMSAAALLHDTFMRCEQLLALRAQLGERPWLSLRDAARLLFGDDGVTAVRGAANLLDAASVARVTVGEQAILPARWHVVFRRIEQLCTCLNPACELRSAMGLPDDWPLGGLHPVPVPACGCGNPVLPLHICQGCGDPLLAGVEYNDGEQRRLRAPARGEDDGPPRFRFIGVDRERALGLTGSAALFDGWEPGTIAVQRRTERCPMCGADGADEPSRPRSIGHTRQLAVSDLLEGLFEELPVDVRGAAGRPNGGRRLIMFSDGRQIAAQLAPLVERSLRERAVRQAILRAVSPASDSATLLLRELLRQLPPGPQRDALEQQLYAPMQIARLAQRLAGNDTTRRQLLPGGEQLDTEFVTEAEIETMLIAELHRRPPLPRSLEAMGLVEICYGGLEHAEPPAEQAWFSAVQWRNMIATMLDSARGRGALLVTSAVAEFLPRWSNNKPIAAPGEAGDGTIPWLGNAMRPWLAAVLRACGLPHDPAAVSALARDLWLSVQRLGVLEPTERGAMIGVARLTVKATMSAFCDPRTGSAYPRSIERISPGSAAPELVAFAWPALLQDGWQELELPSPALRLAVKRLLERPAVTVRAVEHTAQIAVPRLRAFESKFRDGQRNLLSSTTTMELGIDIGQLSAVLLTNAPPSPVNYLQRAGRAGRRSEGSTLIATVTSSNPHDAMLFSRPSWAFEEPGVAPKVRLDRDVVVQRHVNAAFLRAAGLTRSDSGNPMGTLGSCGSFFLPPDSGGIAPVDRLIGWLEHTGSTGERQFRDVSHARVRALTLGTSLEHYTPEQLGLSTAETLRRTTAQWRDTDTALQEAIEDEVQRNTLARANELQRIQRQRRDAFLLSQLAELQVLPRYGFPIDLVSLDTGADERQSDYRLERGLEIGLREYGPGSELIVGATKLRSKGLLLGPYQQYTGSARDRDQLRCHTFCHCRTCGYLAIDLVNASAECPVCGHGLTGEARDGVRPAGFSCELRRGEIVGRTHAIETQEHLPYLPPIFSPDRSATWCAIVPGLEARYARDGLIMHRSDGMYGAGFDICEICGRAESRKSGDRPGFDHKQGQHHMLRRADKTCAGRYRGGIRERCTLVHPIYTDTLEIRLVGPLDPRDKLDESFAMTLAIAIREAAAARLAAPPRELGAQAYLNIDRSGSPRWNMVLFDQVAGGAGFMDDVRGHLPILLREALARLTGDVGHDEVCSSACPRCLLSYSTQFHAHVLDRKKVLRFFDPARLGLLGSPALVAERFGPAARLLPAGIESLLAWIRDSAETVVRLAYHDEIGDHRVFRAMLRLAERSGRSILVLDALPGFTAEGESLHRSASIALERFVLAGGRLRVANSPLPDDAPFADVSYRGTRHLVAALRQNAQLPIESALLVDVPDRADVDLRSGTREAAVEEIRPRVIKILEVLKDRTMERLVPTAGRTARLQIPGGIAADWKGVLKHLGWLTEKELGAAPPFDREPTSVAYADRSLRTERALWSLRKLLAALKARPNSASVFVATLDPGRHEPGVPGEFRSTREVGSAWNFIAPGYRSIAFREVPHARSLDVHYAHGEHWLIELDEGIDVFMDGTRPSTNRAFQCHVTLAWRGDSP